MLLFLHFDWVNFWLGVDYFINRPGPEIVCQKKNKEIALY